MFKYLIKALLAGIAVKLLDNYRACRCNCSKSKRQNATCMASKRPGCWRSV